MSLPNNARGKCYRKCHNKSVALRTANLTKPNAVPVSFRLKTIQHNQLTI